MKLRGFWLPFGVLLMGCLLLMGGADGKAVKKKIVVGQNGNLCQGPLIIACEKGYFKKEGLEVELLKGDYPTLAILHEGGNVKDYTWRDYPAAQLILALEKKEIDAAIIGEQLGIKAVNESKAKLIRFSTLDPDFKDEYCCVLCIRGKIVREDPKTAKKITRAVIRAAKWVATHKEETVKFLLEKKYVMGDLDYNLGLIQTYKYIPSVAGGRQAIKVSIEEFKKLGLFDSNVNVEKEANKIFISYPDVEN